eukprot:Protomagalhaensia_wolfi_Nauph_80__351@NODE_1196_length_1664_cov_197_894769_g918_i0_p1_GENE_NODE_1196_length_1664_cov_197_894769_g918_i0NODE_1196_length_1664_cov_197_894769_g918_i0_p1_ORF_typecomplete_len450_score48_27Cyclin_C/PF02984_19/2_2e10Cyclin_N/PF00134_23/0_42Cyclin_N/PF00134_23/71_NODE_1196_length_1664_cov_197_894769_g918_i01601509
MLPLVTRKQVGANPHTRLWSASTATSTSPNSNDSTSADDQPCPAKQIASFRDPTKSKIPAKPKGKVQRKRRLNFGVEETKDPHPQVGSGSRRRPVAKKCEPARPTMLPTRTPAVQQRVGPPKAELMTSPGGTDYIITPGRHRIEVNEFLANIDAQVADGGCPRMRGMANYAEGIHQQWLEAERQLPSEVFMLSFPREAPMEAFRQMAIQSVFNYAASNSLHENTIHLTVLNINRLIHAKVASTDGKVLTHEMFACTVLAALRAAIKADEYFEKVDKIRLDPLHIWRASGFINYANFASADYNSQRLNAVESECLALLQDPANPPLAPEFMDRYLAVGGWPEHRAAYQELGSFLLGVALFVGGEDNPLRGIPSSKLAAAALVLAIKIINTDQSPANKYEFWPSRLSRYTGYSLEDLKPGIRGLAHLLRHKPPQSKILEQYYTRWGQYDWN